MPDTGSSVPTQSLPGWNLVLSQDFTDTAALGSFAGRYVNWAGYDGAHDTSGNGVYDSGTVSTVHDGMVDQFLQASGGAAQVAALTPPIAGQLYGRYSVRFRADSISGYKIAWLLWPVSEQWTEGEIDFPEADLNETISGFAHDVTGDPSHNAWAVDTGTSMTDWHTATIEWLPDHITFILDGRSWTTTDRTAIPTTPMRWVLQSETTLDGLRPTTSGHIYIDWVAAWSRA